MDLMRVVPPTRKTIIKQTELTNLTGFEFNYGLTIPIYFYRSKNRTLCYYKTFDYLSKTEKRWAFRQVKYISYLIWLLRGTKWEHVGYGLKLDILNAYAVLWSRSVISNAKDFKSLEDQFFQEFDFLSLLKDGIYQGYRVERPMIYDVEPIEGEPQLIKITRYRIEKR